MRIMKTFLGLLAVSLILCAAGALHADDIKTRMLDRLPAIMEMKARGAVGENNQGYLEIRPGQQADRALVADENQDRRTVYGQIAQQTNTNIQIVGQRRALQIAERASPGEWLQDPNGNWYQKDE